MGLLNLAIVVGIVQLVAGASVEDKYEPMVAFICDRPAMHRGVDGWKADRHTDCLRSVEDILAYCQHQYPDHNITNVVEASYLVTIPDWPIGDTDRLHPHRVRPYRCLVGGFQSDALLVPQHCTFDHRHDQSTCEGFSHWNVVADEACREKGKHLESFGMLLNCRLGKFSGVEYVCCPNEGEVNQLPEPEADDKPSRWRESEESEESDEDMTPVEGGDDSVENIDDLNEDTVDFYEAYLRGQRFPSKYNNEHKKFMAAKDRMKKNQQAKTTKLLQQWQAARDHVSEVRKVDEARADQLNKQISERFQKLYQSYEDEDQAEKEQLDALHQQHVQATLNEHKRETMDKYMNSLGKGDNSRIAHNLRAYIKSEEKDRMHTVNHFEHLKASNPAEALRVHPYIVNHLRLSEDRIQQALDMLTGYPDVELQVKPEIDEFMRRFEAVANSIKNVVLPVPEVPASSEETDSSEYSVDSDDSNSVNSDNDIIVDDNNSFDVDSDESNESNDSTVDEEGDDVSEDEHDYERNFAANAQSSRLNAQQGAAPSYAQSATSGTTLGIALGGVSVFMVVVVAIFMVKRKNRNLPRNPEYDVVDPAASPEERHLANMQMNGYENPTYRYFEVTNNPSA